MAYAPSRIDPQNPAATRDSAASGVRPSNREREFQEALDRFMANYGKPVSKKDFKTIVHSIAHNCLASWVDLVPVSAVSLLFRTMIQSFFVGSRR